MLLVQFTVAVILLLGNFALKLGNFLNFKTEENTIDKFFVPEICPEQNDIVVFLY
jgi:hypothetical protein